MQDLTISIIQGALQWQNPAANRAYYDGRLAALDRAGAHTDLVILPEMFATGFTMDAAEHAESMTGESVNWLRLAARDYGVTLCGSLIIEDSGHCYNRLLWSRPDGELGWYDKRHLFRMAGEQHHYAPGRERRVFTLGDWRICPLICYDLRFPAWCRGVNEFDLQVFVANWPAARRSAWRTLLPARAIENQCYTVGVSRIGTDGNDVRYSGDSAVYDYLGAAIVDCGDAETVETVTLSAAALTRYRKKFPAYLDADRFTLHAERDTADR